MPNRSLLIIPGFQGIKSSKQGIAIAEQGGHPTWCDCHEMHAQGMAINLEGRRCAFD